MTGSTGLFYDEFWATRAPDARALGTPEAARLHLIERAVTRHGADRPTRRILDLGCGTGWLTQSLARHGHAVGVDFSAGAIDAARRSAGPRTAFHVRDFVREPLDDLGTFDIVVSAEVVEHVTNKLAFVDRCCRALAPGGVLVLTTPNAGVWSRYWSSPIVDAARWRQPVEDWVTHEQMAVLLRPRFDLLEAHSFILDFDNRDVYRLVNSHKLGRALDWLGLRTPVTRVLEKRWLGLYGFYVARKREQL